MRVKVYHLRNFVDREIRFLAMQGKSVPLTNFLQVAVLEVETLEDAFQASNHIHSDWTTNPQVISLLPDSHLLGGFRSTSVGDMLETPTGFFVVTPTGFVPWEQY